MRNIKAVIAYDGSRYYGFQAQLNPEVLPTVQEVLEEAIGGLLKEETKVHSADSAASQPRLVIEKATVTVKVCSAVSSAFTVKLLTFRSDGAVMISSKASPFCKRL